MEYIQAMANAHYFEVLLSVSHHPAMYGVQDAMDLSAFLSGYNVGSNEPALRRLLGDLTDFLKKKNPEFLESTCGWSHIIKSQSYERGGSIELFRRWLGLMLLEQGHWTDEHFEIFMSKAPLSVDDLRSLPAPQFDERSAGSDL